jgi:hypothetical protein
VLDETDSRPRHRCVENRRRRREQTAVAGSLDGRDYALPAAAQLHRAGRGARLGEGPRGQVGGKELALELEAKGYAQFQGEAA